MRLSSPTVSVASKIAELALPLRSIDTSGSSVYSRMPFKAPSASALKAAFTTSGDASRSSSTVKSISDTSGVGTRTAMPCILPLSCGITRCNACAAPVLVGIMDTAAARARRKSLWGRSRSCWSFVYEWIVVINPCLMP